MNDGYDKPQTLNIKSAPKLGLKTFPIPKLVKILHVITVRNT
jgi:hypothetical protein